MSVDITLTPPPIEVSAPTLTPNFGTRVGQLAPARVSVIAPVLSVVVGEAGRTLADLDLSPPNIITQTLFEVRVGAALGLPEITLQAQILDIVKRRYETSTPIYGYSPTGKTPIPKDTGLYLCNDDLSAAWHDIPLPEFPQLTDISQPVLIERDGTGFLFFADRRGQVARYNLSDRSTLLATFTGTTADLALGRTANGLAVEPGSSQVVLYAGGQACGIWRSTDNGAHFSLSNGGMGSRLAGSAVTFHPTEVGLCYAGGFVAGSLGAPLYKSTDSGSTWTLVHTRPTNNGRIMKIVLGDDPDIVYIQTENHVIKSGDQGENFTAIETGLPDPLTGLGAFAIAPSDETILYVGVGIPGTVPERHRIYLSEDSGATWTQKLELIPGRTGPIITGGIAVHPTDPDQAAFATFGPLSESGVYRTDDAGDTWEVAGEAEGITDPFQLFGITYGTVDSVVRMAASGRHGPMAGASFPTGPQKVIIGQEVTFGERHEATITFPFAQEFIDAISDRTDESGPTPVFPDLKIYKVARWRSGAIQRERLAEIQMQQIDVKQSGQRQFSVFGAKQHDNIARGPQAVRTIAGNQIERIEESTLEYSVTLPGIRTDWNSYDEMTVNGRASKISAVRYSITKERRSTVLGVTARSSARINPTVPAPLAHPRVTIGSTPTNARKPPSFNLGTRMPIGRAG